jgi:hypothetical protein
MFHPEREFPSLANLVVVFAPLCLSLRPPYAQILEYSLNTQAQALWLPAIQGLPPIEYGQTYFIDQISCLYPTYIRGEAYLAARQGTQAAAEFQKILDHSGIVWNCWAGALARLGVARANAL